MSVVDVVLPHSPPMTSSQSNYTTSRIPAVSTPNDSPTSFPGSSNLGSRKRVEFSEQPNIHNSAALQTSPINSSSIRPLPPSRECQSSKSILKIKEEDVYTSYGVNNHYEEQKSMNEIMESVVLQLSRNDKTTSLDAYQTLAAAIKVYDEIPEEAILRNKLLTIVKYIRRDLHVLDKPDALPTDSNLVTQALKVLVIIVWSNVFSPLLTDEIRIFILDRSLQVISEHTAPKSVIIHYLHLLATQNFRSALVVSNNRASRLLDALKTVTEHVKGNGAVSERLLVYQKLIDQARSTMKARAHCWTEEMLSGLVSSVSDTRLKALSLGRKACQAYLASSSISTSIRGALDRELDSGRTLGTTICRKLEIMVTKKEDAVQVPQIWAVVLLLCNGSDNKIDSWTSLKDWLKVIQRCFNSSDSAVRQQANMAWNRFVYVVRPHEASESLVSMLAKPIIAQVERNASDKASKSSQIAAVSSYCNLLYYSFRPAATHKQYSRSWNQYIVKVMRTTFFEKHLPNADIASRILTALFWDPRTSPKVWNENRAHEHTTVEAEELPTIDYKWTRSKCSAILEVFALLFKYSSWGLSGSSDQAYVSRAWRHLLKAIREAGAKEVKASSEARNAANSIINFIADLWELRTATDDPKKPADLVFRLDILNNITQTAILELGVLQFVEALEHSQRSCPIQILQCLWTVFSSTTNVTTTGDLRLSQRAAMTRMFPLFDQALTSAYQDSCQTTGISNINDATSLISQILSDLPAWLSEAGFSGIETSLSTWLSDERYILSSTQHTSAKLNGSSLNETSIERMVRVVRGLLFTIEQDTLLRLDRVIAAAFSSTQEPIVSAAVSAWNIGVRVLETFSTGPLLSVTLQRLKSTHDLISPTKQLNVVRPEQPLEHISRVEGVNQGQVQPLSPSVGETEEADSSTILRQLAERVGNQDSKNQNNKRKHDDSQIVFVAIPSSPPDNIEPESQFLTARQSEIRDRRRVEPAVVFPDLRSSPKTQSRSHSRAQSRGSATPDCNFARKVAALNDRPSTPVLTEPNNAETRDLEPSPTPKARHLSKRLPDLEVPSSPPSIIDNAEKRRHVLEDFSSPPQEAITERGDIDLDLVLGAATTDSVQTNDNFEKAGYFEVRTRSSALNQMIANRLGEDDTKLGNAEASQDIATEQAMPKLRNDMGSPGRPQIVERSNHDHKMTSPPEQASSQMVASPLFVRSADSDDLDDLSASQLSHDLDWHVTLEERLSAAPSNTADAIHHDQPIQKEVEESNSRAVKNKRKRPSAAKTNRGLSKKRRRTSSQSFSLSSQDIEQSIAIGADSSSSAAVVEKVNNISVPGEGDDNTAAIQGVIPDMTSELYATIEDQYQPMESVQVHLEQKTQEASRPTSTSQTPIAVHSPQRALVNSSVSLESVVEASMSELGEQQAARVVVDSVEEPVQQNIQGPVDIIANLQSVLDQIKNASPGTIDLRSVDELCFQIRFEAQVRGQMT